MRDSIHRGTLVMHGVAFNDSVNKEASF